MTYKTILINPMSVLMIFEYWGSKSVDLADGKWDLSVHCDKENHACTKAANWSYSVLISAINIRDCTFYAAKQSMRLSVADCNIAFAQKQFNNVHYALCELFLRSNDTKIQSNTNKNLCEISSLSLARVLRFAADNIDMYSILWVKFKMMWMVNEELPTVGL